MKPTLTYIQQKFAEYNALIFKNALPPLPMRIGNAKSTLGGVSFKRHRRPDGTIEFSNFKLTISARLDLPENVVQDTLIHEMIHYYILNKQLHDTSPHGQLFKQLMRHINQHFGRHITITHHSLPDERQQDTRKKEHWICISHMEDGRTGITISAKTRIFEMWRMLPQYFRLKKMDWYWSADPFFNQYPNSHTPRIFAIKPEVLSEHLKGAIELECDGHTFRKKE